MEQNIETKMEQLKSKVDNCIRIHRKYYKSGDRDLILATIDSVEQVKELNEKVSKVLDNFTYIYIDNSVSYSKIYEILDILCNTQLTSIKKL